MWTLAGVAVLAIGTIQVILWSDLPRRIVLDSIRKSTALSVSADAVNTGWFGHTTITNLRIAAPLADQPMVVIPQIRASHTSLIPLLITGNLKVDSLEVDQPQVTLHRDAAGQWQVPPVFASAADKSPSTNPSIPSLPAIHIQHGTVHLSQDAAPDVLLSDIAVVGKPASSPRYDLSVTIPGQLDLSAQIALTSAWQHDVQIKATPSPTLVAAFVPHWTGKVDLQGIWSGHLASTGLVGQLTLKQFVIPELTATGRVDIQQQPSAWIFSPHDLAITPQPALFASQAQFTAMSMATMIPAQALLGSGLAGSPIASLLEQSDISPPAAFSTTIDHASLLLASNDTAPASAPAPSPWIDKPILFSNGQVKLNDDGLTVQNMLATANYGRFTLDGKWVAADQPASLQMGLSQVKLPSTVIESGQFQFHWNPQSPIDPTKLWASLTATGKTSNVPWNIQSKSEGTLHPAGNLVLQTTFANLDLDAPVNANLDGLSFRLLTRPAGIEMDHLALPESDRLKGNGYYNLSNNNWNLSLKARQVPTHIGSIPQCDLLINMTGDPRAIHLTDSHLLAGRLQATIEGDYQPGRQQPLKLEVSAVHPNKKVDPSDIWLEGGAEAAATLTGSLAPLQLNLAGTLSGKDVHLLGRTLGDMQMDLTGSIHDGLLDVQSSQFKVLGGQWNLSSRSSLDDDFLTTMQIQASDVQLADAATAMRLPALTGTLSGKWNLSMPRMDFSKASLGGTFSAIHPALLTDMPYAQADQVTGNMTLDDGLLSFDNLMLTSAGGRITGSASRLDTQDPSLWKIKFQSNNWPVTHPLIAGKAQVSGKGDIQLDLDSLSAKGPVQLAIALEQADQPAGHMTADAQINGRSIHVRKLEVDALGGTAVGWAMVDLDHLEKSTGQLQANNILSSRLVRWVPAIDGLTGQLDASVSLSPSTDKRALEPCRVQLAISPKDMSWRGVKVTAATFDAYASANRLVLQDGKINLADGQVGVWGRISNHKDGATAMQINLDLHDLSLTQLARAINPLDQSTNGLLSGQIILAGPLADRSHVFGQAQLDVSQSDLVQMPVLTVLYNAMRLGTASSKPMGTGHFELRLDGPRLDLTQAKYFNRGAEVRALATFSNIYAGKDCPLTATVIGSARPLKDIKLPYMADVDKILESIQSNITSYAVTGTPDNYLVQPITFAAINTSLKRLLFGEVQR